MALDFDIGDGADALGRNQLIDALDGTYWVSGWDWSLGTGDLEVDIAAGEGAINGGDVSTDSTQTVDFTGDVDATDPRKAVISVDDTGTVQKTLGTAVPAAPTDEVRFRTFDPAPPTNAPGVVVAEVWLAAGTTSLTTDDVRHRRVANQAAVNSQPNEPNWVEDANSPEVISGATDATYTLDGTYDIVRVFVKATNGTNIGSKDLILNNDSGSNYTVTTLSGSTSESNPGIPIGNPGTDGNTHFTISGTWDLWASLSASPVALTSGSANSVAQQGTNSNVTSPLDSFTIEGLSDAVIEVYGKDIE